MSESCQPCQEISCVPPSDLSYNLEKLVPKPLPPVTPPTPQPPTPPTCQPAPFEKYTLTGNIDGTVDAPNRPGSFAELIPIELTVGIPVNFWMRSAAVDAYLILVDPDGNVVAEDDLSGWSPSPDVDNAALSYSPLQTGTYTLECTTYSPGETGAFSVIVSPGPVGTITTQNDYNSRMLFVPTTNRLFLVDAIITSGKMVVVSVLNNTITKSWDLISLAPGGLLVPEYSSVQDRIFVSADLITDPYVLEFSSDGLTLIGQTKFVIYTGSFSTYDSVNDRILYGNINSQNYAVFDCATRTFVQYGTFTKPAIFSVYCPTTQQYYVHAQSGNDLVMDANTFVQSGLSVAAGSGLLVGFYLPEIDRYLFRATGGGAKLVHPVTFVETVIVAENVQFGSGMVDVCNQEIRMGTGSYGMISVNLSDYSPANSIPIGAANRGDPVIVIPSVRRTYVNDYFTNGGNAEVTYIIP